MTQNPHPTNRSRVPQSERFMNFISSNWAEIDSPPVTRWEVADHSLKRREALSAKFPGKVLVIEATEPRVRANDTDYRYRPATAFTHLTGWGSATVPGSVLVIDGRKNVSVSTLYLMPTAGRDSDEFFANPAIGEFWVGPRPTLTQVSLQLGIITKDLTKLDADLASIGAVVDMEDPELAEAASTLRFVKDQFEIAQMREAVRITVDGFAEVARSIPQATKQARGERVVETAFYSVARQNGFELGYETIAASGPNACILHWTKNDGEVKHGDLILVDAGAELDSLYTADVTRTIPVNGKFSKEQLWVYNTVLEAADAAFAVVKPGIRFREVHNAAIEVIARRVAELGVIPVTAEEALEKDNQHHRRYMVHGTSHHLGLDVHDCAQARREMYQDGILEKGMIFTIEPGLYFHKSDLNLPPEYRGIGVRIEDDVLVTESGYENLSSALPRTASDVENWFAEQIS
ncbi:aminopeptidase P family protein [Candidatus Aquiluna sp. IMCC13023]|uniref:aminopeptidase P family protein n=1 Tax=Candidatus Aquiluna sp. IMCC13023 TaxID=1081644 RepID=UPI00058F2403|nr:aminopeptidase P family protein [Candidatus Aquiluna sp. IMCC13023]